MAISENYYQGITKMNKVSQHVNPKDYPSVDDIAAYVESLKLCLAENGIKDEEIKKLVQNLPSPQNVLKRLSNQEIKVLFQTVGYLWKKVTGHDMISDSKIEDKKEMLFGNYWIIQKGILVEGQNHFTIVKQNMELFRILLGINAFALHEKIGSPPNELIKLIINHGGVRVFVDKNRKGFFQMSDETYAKWGKHKVKKYDLNKKIVKVVDISKPYRGWYSGITVLL